MAGLLVVAGLLATTTVGCDRGSRQADAKLASWVALPRLGTDSPHAVDGASIVDVRGVVHVIVVDRGPGRSRSRVVTYRETTGGWTDPSATPELPVDRDGRVDVVGGRRLCVAALDHARLRVRCLHGQRWRSLGNPVFSADSDDTNAGAFTTPSGGLTVLRNRRVSPTGRFETTVWQWSQRRGWHTLGGDVAPMYPGGSQRPFGVVTRRGLCVAYDGMRADPTYGSDIALSCHAAGGWELVYTRSPFADAATVRAPRILSGAVAVDDGIRVGAHKMGSTGGSWDIYPVAARSQRPAMESDPGAGWTAQGELFDISGEAWAIRFDQASHGPSLSTLATRLVVLRERGGAFQRIGSPLRDADRFNGPLYFGLVASGDRILAMATVPVPGQQRDEVRVFELTGLPAATRTR